jgi:hypothetical protein
MQCKTPLAGENDVERDQPQRRTLGLAGRGRGAKPAPVSGVPLALRDGRGATHLLFGDWEHLGNYASNPFDEAAPTTRVQDVSVRLDGNDAVTEQLLKKLDLSAISNVMQQ